jgi:hypothetical protein
VTSPTVGLQISADDRRERSHLAAQRQGARAEVTLTVSPGRDQPLNGKGAQSPAPPTPHCPR